MDRSRQARVSERRPRAAGERRPFPKRVRLRRRDEYLRVQRTGMSRHTPHFVVLSRPQSAPTSPRMGVTVSRKIGNAVERNRVKRTVREFFRLHVAPCEISRDFVFVAKMGATELSYADVVRELAPTVRSSSPA